MTTKIKIVGTESHENPFLANSELSKKAEYIVRNSTISRTEIRIADPDKVPPPSEDTIVPAAAVKASASPPTKHGDMDGVVPEGRENGKVEEPLKPESVEVQLTGTNIPPEGHAEAVDVPKNKKKCACCLVQ